MKRSTLFIFVLLLSTAPVHAQSDGKVQFGELSLTPGRLYLQNKAQRQTGLGIDTNHEVVAAGRRAGLDMRQGDAIDVLGRFEPASVSAVTSFHVVEHVRIPQLLEMIAVAFRVLEPGGRLILETPNPTNLLVGSATFYRDPTHLRPIHPDLLAFLVGEAGFTDIETRFLHPISDEMPDDVDSPAGRFERDLHWAIRGPQDYAVLATKPLPPSPA